MEPPAEPRVTVVTPSLDQGAFIAECIASVTSQDYDALEHVVVDGGSTDGTLDVLRAHEGDRLRWVSEPDAGQSDAINKGWRMAPADILAWMNADDSYLPGAVRKAVDFLVVHPDVDIVYGDCEWVDEQGHAPVAHTSACTFDPARLMVHDFIPSGSAFMRREVLDVAGLIDVRFHYVMDWEFWLRAASRGCRFAFLPVPLSRFRVHAGAKTWAHDLARGREIALLMERLEKIAPIPAERRKAQAQGLLSAALLAGRAGERREALGYYARSIRGRHYRPSSMDLRPAAAAAFGPRGERAADVAVDRLKHYLRRGHESG